MLATLCHLGRLTHLMTASPPIHPETIPGRRRRNRFDVPEAAEFRQGLVERVAVNIEAYEAPEVLHGLVETRAAYREV